MLELLFSVLAGVTEEPASLEPRKPPPIPMQATKAREAVIIATRLAVLFFGAVLTSILVVMCILLPMLAKGSYGVGMPWFCKWICPSGTLLGGIPLLALNEELRSVIGWLFTWKLFILVVIITGSILMYRPFCRYICPLGAIYGLMNPVSLVRMRVSKSRCVGCGACQKACGLDIPVYKEPNSTDCIRCGKCVTVCPHNALKLDVSLKGKRKRRARQEDADA